MQVIAKVHGVRELQLAFANIDRRVDRATMWTVREGGRVAGRTARTATPVYKGKGSVSRKQLRTGPSVIRGGAPVKGLLRGSIKSGKRLKKTAPGSYAVHVAPRGPRVRLYSQKIEARSHYMETGYRAAISQMTGIAARAWARATRGM